MPCAAPAGAGSSGACMLPGVPSSSPAGALVVIAGASPAIMPEAGGGAAWKARRGGSSAALLPAALSAAAAATAAATKPMSMLRPLLRRPSRLDEPGASRKRDREVAAPGASGCCCCCCCCCCWKAKCCFNGSWHSVCRKHHSKGAEASRGPWANGARGCRVGIGTARGSVRCTKFGP